MDDPTKTRGLLADLGHSADCVHPDQHAAVIREWEDAKAEVGILRRDLNMWTDQATALKAATDRVREWHHPMPVYDGDPDCLDGGGCVHGEDYPDGEEGPNGGFCPHTSKAAVICFACSYQDTEGEGGTWPRWGWVLHENCATIFRLDHPTDTTGETMKIDDLTGAIEDALDYVLDNSHTTPNVDLTRFRKTRQLVADGALVLLFTHHEAAPTDTTGETETP